MPDKPKYMVVARYKKTVFRERKHDRTVYCKYWGGLGECCSFWRTRIPS
jgi:hypothetical protein